MCLKTRLNYFIFARVRFIAQMERCDFKNVKKFTQCPKYLSEKSNSNYCICYYYNNDADDALCSDKIRH